MRFLIVLLFLAFYSSRLFSQNPTMLQDPLSSKRFNTEKYAAIRGTPFLVDKWLSGTAETVKGKYDGIELKFNVYDNTLLINKDDEPYELNENINSFTLNTGKQLLLFRKVKTSVNFNSDVYLQVLAEGNINLLKLHIKKLAEMSEINAGIVQTFTNSEKYYIEINNTIQILRTDRESIKKLVPSFEDRINTFLQGNKISLNKEEGIKKLFEYINSLK